MHHGQHNWEYIADIANNCSYIVSYIIQYQCLEAVELLASAGWLPRQARDAKSGSGGSRVVGVRPSQVEYAEAVSSLYTSKEGRFLDVLLGKFYGGSDLH